MAGRLQRRLQKQLVDDLPKAAALGSDAEGSEEEEEEEEAASPPTKAFNPFAAFLTDEEEGAGAGPEAGSEEEAEEEQQQSPAAAAAARQPGASAKSKKRRAKKKGKGKAAAEGLGPEAAAQPGGEEGAAEDIDAILQELNIRPAQPSPGPGDAAVAAAAPPSSGAGGSSGARGAEQPLLGVDVRNLSANEELRRMFGSRVLEEEDEERGDAFAGASRRVRRLAARGLLRRAELKRGLIIQPRDTWPRFDGGATQEYLGVTPEGKMQFSYTFSQGYQAVQELYEQCQASFDPNNIAALLHSHPYHLDALLTMHDLYRSMGENAYADEMLERCVYACEMAWHPSFNPAAANMLVPFDEPNKPLFLSLFKYQQALSRRGLHRTALEVCKLLLALNPLDPTGALFALDYLAVRAGRYAFLQQFVDFYSGGDQSVQLYPNYVFSLALARWYQEQEQGDSGKRGRSSSSSAAAAAAEGGSAGGAAQQQKSSGDLLTKAVLMYPLVVLRLMGKLQEKGTGKDADWSYLLSQPLLRDAGDGGSASLGHLADLFVERQHLIWKAQPIQEWLKAACRRALAGDDLPDSVTAADWACVREQAFPPSDDNAYSHLRLYDFSDTVQRIPPEDMHGLQQPAGGGGGGLPPGIREEDLAAMRAELQQLDERVRAEGRVPEEYLREGNPLMMMLRTLLPWFNAGEQPDYGAEEEGVGEWAEEGGGEGDGTGGQPPPRQQ